MICGKVLGQIRIWTVVIVIQSQISELNTQTYKDL